MLCWLSVTFQIPTCFIWVKNWNNHLNRALAILKVINLTCLNDVISGIVHILFSWTAGYADEKNILQVRTNSSPEFEMILYYSVTISGLSSSCWSRFWMSRKSLLCVSVGNNYLCFTCKNKIKCQFLCCKNYARCSHLLCIFHDWSAFWKYHHWGHYCLDLLTDMAPAVTTGVPGSCFVMII